MILGLGNNVKKHLIWRFWSSTIQDFINPLSAEPTKWSNTLKQCVDELPTICLSVFGHSVGLALKGLKIQLKLSISKRK